MVLGAQKGGGGIGKKNWLRVAAADGHMAWRPCVLCTVCFFFFLGYGVRSCSKMLASNRS